MHDKLLCPVFKLIHKPDGGAVLLELWLHAISIARGQKKNMLSLLHQVVNHKKSPLQCFMEQAKEYGGNLCKEQTLVQTFMITLIPLWRNSVSKTVRRLFFLCQKAELMGTNRQE